MKDESWSWGLQGGWRISIFYAVKNETRNPPSHNKELGKNALSRLCGMQKTASLNFCTPCELSWGNAFFPGPLHTDFFFLHTFLNLTTSFIWKCYQQNCLFPCICLRGTAFTLWAADERGQPVCRGLIRGLWKLFSPENFWPGNYQSDLVRVKFRIQYARMLSLYTRKFVMSTLLFIWV